MTRFVALLLLALTGSAAAFASLTPLCITEQSDGHAPVPWKSLSADEQAAFDLGHAVFNTMWLPAGEGSGRRDGLGPVFNAPSCDACHNSRRRGRGPIGDGPAPTDVVMQVAQQRADGHIARGHPRFGRIINPDAIAGTTAEAALSITYRARDHVRADGSRVTLHVPRYDVRTPDGATLPTDLVLMPRMASMAQGVGLLEQIPERDIVAGARGRRGKPAGDVPWIETPQGRQLGRFGWQATEPTVAHQVSVAFAREMGLTSEMVDAIDCAPSDHACLSAASGGTPEVAPELFQAVLQFQQHEAVRRTPQAAQHLREHPQGARLFAEVGCAGCHRSNWKTPAGVIAPYTDLLLHDLGPELADRTTQGMPVSSRWRTAPLWGMSTALEGRRPVRLLHDGRARSVEQAIAWHGGAAAGARQRFDHLDAARRQQLLDWVSAL